MVAARNVLNAGTGSLRVVEMPDQLPEAREAQVANLESRLADGYQRIESALSRGEDVHVWEDFWISLLRSYEQLCDEMEEAA